MSDIVCKSCGNVIFKKTYMVRFFKEEYGEISEWKISNTKGIDCKIKYVCFFCGLELVLSKEKEK